MGSRKSRTLLKLLAVERGRHGYRLAGEPEVGVDLDAAARCCEQARGTLPAAPAIALAAAEQAIGLLSADIALAEEPYATWADPAREQLRQLLRQGRLTAAEAAMAIEEASSAARYAEAALAADPLDETACRWYMSASAAAGEPARALVAYEALRERLAEELGADPSPQTQELHLAILRQQDRDRAERHEVPARSVHPDRSVRPGRSVRPDRHRRVLAGRDGEARALREAWDRAVAGDVAWS